MGVEEFEQAIMRSMLGVERKTGLRNAKDRQNVALHEAGHAVVSTAVERLLVGWPTVEKLSIVPRSKGSLGRAPRWPYN